MFNKKQQEIINSIHLNGKGKPRKPKPAPEPKTDKRKYLGQRAITQYLQHLEAMGKSQNYIRNSRIALFRYWTFLHRHSYKGISRAGRIVWHDYAGYLNDRGLSKRTIGSNQSAVRCFYKYLVGEGEIPTNPFKDMHSPKFDKLLPQFLSSNEIDQLIDSIDTSSPLGMRNKALIELAYAAGLRRSELTSIDLSQIKFEAKEILIRGKGNKERVVMFGIPAYKALTQYVTWARPQLVASIGPVSVGSFNNDPSYVRYLVE